MKITALVENITKSDFKARHGLSLYIETHHHKILFDLGPDKTVFENAKKRSIDLSNIDIVIISHGHIDHGGALEQFLKVNSKAKIYLQKKAFEPHYSKTLFLKIPVGINGKIKNHSQIILLDGDHVIDNELRLITVQKTDRCYSPLNDALYNDEGIDDFSHEQHLIISENSVALITGCGHSGIVNIMDQSNTDNPKSCIGGFHLYNPITKRSVSKKLLDALAAELQIYPQTKFYTCHCTGLKAFQYLSERLPNLAYLFCGDSIYI